MSKKPDADEPRRRGWVIFQGAELGWTMREVELPESVIEAHLVRSWPAEIMAVVLSILERRISRILVERIDDAL